MIQSYICVIQSLYFWEFFFFYGEVWCYIYLLDKLSVESIGIDYYTFNMTCRVFYLIGFLFGVVVGFIADACVPRKVLILIGQSVVTVSPLSLCMVNSVWSQSIYLTMVLIGVFIVFQGIRTASILEQMYHTEELNTIESYVIILLLQRQLAIMFAYVAVQYFPFLSPSLFIYHSVICFFFGLMYVCSNFLITKHLQYQPCDRLVEKSVGCLFSAISNKIRGKNKDGGVYWTSRASHKYGIIEMESAYALFKFIITFLPLIFYGSVEYILVSVSYSHESTHFLSRDNILFYANLLVLLNVFKCIMLCILLALVTLHFSCIHNLLYLAAFGYFLLICGLIAIILLSYREIPPITPYNKTYGIISVYNGLHNNSEVVVSSTLGKSELVLPLREALNVKVFDEQSISKKDSEIYVQIKNGSKAYYTFQREPTSISNYIITEKGLTKVIGSVLTIFTEYHRNHAILFVIYHQHPVPFGLFITNSSGWHSARAYLQIGTGATSIMPILLHEGTYDIHFTSINGTCFESLELEKRNIYGIYPAGFDELLNFCYKTNHLIKTVIFRFNYAIIPLILLAVGDSFAKFAIFLFVFLHAPTHLLGTIISYIIFLLHADIIPCFLFIYSPIPLGLIPLLFPVLLIDVIALILFILFAKTFSLPDSMDPTNQYYVPMSDKPKKMPKQKKPGRVKNEKPPKAKKEKPALVQNEPEKTANEESDASSYPGPNYFYLDRKPGSPKFLKMDEKKLNLEPKQTTGNKQKPALVTKEKEPQKTPSKELVIADKYDKIKLSSQYFSLDRNLENPKFRPMNEKNINLESKRK